MEGATCPSCGATRGPGDRFCGACGADLAAAPKGPYVSEARPNKPVHETMVGVAPPQKAVQKTMLGMMSPLAEKTLEAVPQTTEKPAPAAPRNNVPAQTMLGMPVPPQAQSVSGPKHVEAGKAPGKRLTDPVPGPDAIPQGRRTTFGVDEAASAPHALPSDADAAKGPSATHLTMVGSAQAADPKPGARPVISPLSHRTMLGNAPAPVITPPAAAPAPEPARSNPRKTADGRPRSFTPVPTAAEPARDSQAFRASSVPPPVPGQRSLGLVLGVAGVTALLLLLGGVAVWLMSREPDVRVKVVSLPAEGASQAGGDALEVDVPNAKPGARVRFGGEEFPLHAGRARFPLRADALPLGDNALAVSVVSPGGDVETATVHLQVDYRVRADLAALAAQPPGVDVVIDARPGSSVQLDGTPLPLDARGRGTRRYAIPPQTTSAFALKARYRIDLPADKQPATPVEGEVNVSLPVTVAQIDRPGPDVITDQALLEVAGAVEPTAEVVVEGRAVPVTDGRFLYRAHLPQPGEYKLNVVARAPGKVPRVIAIRVRRVSDMGVAAATFKHDPSLTYARIAQNPLIYRGQSVAFDGRVYNVEVQGGHSVLQMLALDCPAAARCPLWVELPQATEATADTWVRVLGTVAGEQQFRSKQGQVQTVPSVQAQYVLKLAR